MKCLEIIKITRMERSIFEVDGNQIDFNETFKCLEWTLRVVSWVTNVEKIRSDKQSRSMLNTGNHLNPVRLEADYHIVGERWTDDEVDIPSIGC